MSVEQNKQLIADFFVAMSEGDLETLVNAYADDGDVRTMGNTLISGTYGKQQISEFAGQVYDAFPNGLKFTVTGMTAEGDRVAVEAICHGEHVSGKVYNNEYHFLFVLENGKIRHLREYLDTEMATEVLCGGQRP